MIKKGLIIILLLLTESTSSAFEGYQQIVRENSGIYLNYNDLVNLAKTASPGGELGENLQKQLNSPIIKQISQSEAGFLQNNTLGNFLRIASWNIERGFNVELIQKIFQASNETTLTSTEDKKINEELKLISQAQIIILNEVDIGIPRTNYENIADKLADNLKMNYVFGTEFIEVDPYQLGIRKFTEDERKFLETKALEQLDNINQNRYYGLHGNAILSKYPILNTKIIRLPVCYDWFNEESKKLSALENLRRETAEKVFSSKVLSELRHGGRIAIVTDLLLPNKQKITVVGTHLENRCLSECRVTQLEFLLNRLRHIRNPIILAGDFNTTGTDASPVSVKKEVLKKVKDPEFIAKQAILNLTPITFAQNLILNTANVIRKHEDPTTRNIPFVLPNKERKFFDLIKEFRFLDGCSFDVRGIPKKAYKGKLGLLSNSNERDLKGFKPTFELAKNFGLAKYKLDWMFIKPLNLKDSNDKNGSYAYAPHFGRTLQLVNRAFEEKISDHDPIIVDIPVNEPSI